MEGGDPQLSESSHCALAEQELQMEVIFSYKYLQNTQTFHFLHFPSSSV